MMAMGEKQQELTLDPDTLRLLGDEGGTVANTSPPIHVGLVPIWSGILKAGLKDEIRDSLITRYPIAENCPTMAPPRMNLEVKAVVNEVTVKRDARFSTIQAMLGASLSALGQSLTILGNALQEEGKARLLASIGDAARLIAGVHQQQSQARRAILRAQLNKSLADTLSEAPGDDGWLFGENLSERIQSAKALDRTAAHLRKAKGVHKA
ncbi:hypothetical protein NQ314_014847 [Rhamnusium bicolor]|uniref:Uncharacterized protein n=1 Tax=Rhamnusium bicolor TaxID=1586634 RepID=A0AAV8X1D0_9CUCU|nr:hypothetical protein NQ314_014847 [Rhamnusium bicolor]